MQDDYGLSFCSTLISIMCYLILILSSLKVIDKCNLNSSFAIIPIIIYTISSNIIVYSRHLLPYEVSITLYVLSLSLLVYDKYYLSGFFCMVSILTYNGFSATFISVNIFVIFFILYTGFNKVKNFLIYSIGILSPLAILQVIGICFEINYFYGLLIGQNMPSSKSTRRFWDRIQINSRNFLAK